MRKLFGAALAAALAASMLIAPQSAFANHCNDDIYVFSYTAAEVDEETTVRNPTIVPEATCLVLTESDGVDTRVIYPGSTAISVRLTTDLGTDEGGNSLEISGHVTGLGVDRDITLTREELIGGGSFTYDSDLVFIDPAERGYLEVTVDLPISETEVHTFEDTYRTVDQPSPGDGNHLP